MCVCVWGVVVIVQELDGIRFSFFINEDLFMLHFYIFFKSATGDVELNNMQLKPEALNALKLPVKVKAGFLGSVKLKACPNID